MTATERLMQEQVDMLVRDFAQMRERAERAEAALRAALDSKEIFRICWEKAEAELAAKVTPCAWVWNPTDDSDEVGAGHETQCGAWYSGDGSTPNFCPNCGRPVASY